MTDRSVMFINDRFVLSIMQVLRRASGILYRISPVKHEMNIIMAILVTATCGSFLQIAGTSWDVTSHIMQELPFRNCG